MRLILPRSVPVLPRSLLSNDPTAMLRRDSPTAIRRALLPSGASLKPCCAYSALPRNAKSPQPPKVPRSPLLRLEVRPSVSFSAALDSRFAAVACRIAAFVRVPFSIDAYRCLPTLSTLKTLMTLSTRRATSNRPRRARRPHERLSSSRRAPNGRANDSRGPRKASPQRPR